MARTNLFGLNVLVIVLNTAAIAVLLAIPIGKLLGVIEGEVGTAAVLGWLIFFVPLLATVVALWGLQFSRPALTDASVTVAMPGSFLVAFLSVITSLRSPSDLTRIGIGATTLFALNVFTLWRPFLARIQTES